MGPNRFVSGVKKRIPFSVKKWWWRQLSSEPQVSPFGNVYERLYETHAQGDVSDEAVGGGDFETIGRVELDLLLMEGLKPTDTLVDFGCGTGRLAVQAIPMLSGGSYIGIDISDTFLSRANTRIQEAVPAPPCRVRWMKQTTPTFPLGDQSADMICAFSVFTHMEHEDSYRYLKDARRVIRPSGCFIFSCLPMNLADAKQVFVEQANEDIRERWSGVRNVTTSVDLMEEIARLAGWRPARWYAGDENNIGSPGKDKRALGQSSCVLVAS
jgi:SAM-dependent methyltransferase